MENFFKCLILIGFLLGTFTEGLSKWLANQRSLSSTVAHLKPGKTQTQKSLAKFHRSLSSGKKPAFQAISGQEVSSQKASEQQNSAHSPNQPKIQLQVTEPRQIQAPGSATMGVPKIDWQELVFTIRDQMERQESVGGLVISKIESIGEDRHELVKWVISQKEIPDADKVEVLTQYAWNEAQPTPQESLVQATDRQNRVRESFELLTEYSNDPQYLQVFAGQLHSVGVPVHFVL